MAEPPTLAKLVLLGDMGAGKSCLVIRFVKGTFDEHHESTIGAAFTTKTMPEHGVKLEIWDTAGQERYHSLAPMYYRGAAAAIIVFDVTDTQSFEKAKAWVGELQRQATANIVMALAANKVDLADARKVTAEEGKAYASANNLSYIETSAKEGTNVKDLFELVANKIPKATPQSRPAGNINLAQGQATSQSSCCS